MRHVSVGALALVLMAISACSGSDDSSGKKPEDKLVGAIGVQLSETALFQGPKRTLMIGGQAGEGVPLVQGRDALFRAYYSTNADYDGEAVLATLDLLDGQPPIEKALILGPGSSDADLGSTINFEIPGSRIKETFQYSLSMVQFDNGRGDNQFARFAQQVAVVGKPNKLRILIVPYAYNADGSGRVPDTSEEQVERYRERFRSLYPVSDVEVSVHAPVPWNSPIQPNGNGWQEVGLNLFGIRGSEGIPPDTYLYGVFNPTASIGQFCGGGCLLGVTLLNDNPPDEGSVSLRLALGVGFPQVALNTAAHEIGHAHGRRHANCGPGLDPQSIDGQYPHANGRIGDWGYDITNGDLHDPAVATDIMSYCDNQFISGYNYTSLFARGQNVNSPKIIGAPADYWIVASDGLGSTRWQKTRFAGIPSGQEVEVTVDTSSASGLVSKAWYTPYDHLDGGWLFLPASVGEITRIEHAAGGARQVLRR